MNAAYHLWIPFTMLAAAGLAVPADMQGNNALGVLAGDTPGNWRTSMYYRYYHYPQDHKVQPHKGIRTLTHKLIHVSKIDQWELYDLTTDPHEMKNLIREPGQQAKVTELKAQMLALKKDLGDEDQFANQPPPGGVDGQPKKK